MALFTYVELRFRKCVTQPPVIPFNLYIRPNKFTIMKPASFIAGNACCKYFIRGKAGVQIGSGTPSSCLKHRRSRQLIVLTAFRKFWPEISLAFDCQLPKRTARRYVGSFLRAALLILVEKPVCEGLLLPSIDIVSPFTTVCHQSRLCVCC